MSNHEAWAFPGGWAEGVMVMWVDMSPMVKLLDTGASETGDKGSATHPGH